MAWVRFTAPFDWTPPKRPMVTIAYPTGPFSVTAHCATKAVKAGKAVRIPAPKRGQDADIGQFETAPPVPASRDD